MYEPHIDLTGHLGADPALRFTPNGVPVGDLRVATTRRYKLGEEWLDGETLWFEVVVWKQLALHVFDSLHKGDKVTVSGRLLQRRWEKEDGTSGTKLVIDAVAVGVDLARAPVLVKVPVRDGSVVGQLPERWEDRPAPELADEVVEEIAA